MLKKKITLISNEETKPYLEKAKSISPDPKDVDYFALAIKLNCGIWGNDKELSLKQTVVLIYSTNDLVKYFL
ncbi:MAG: hypothetical protein COT14_01125 [Candidatus Diapherotrites archaeon CG08_land_8_20_14_0_20_30_16]|nr:MAG: hypothetical protein COT14_01125 [Candidatus Diapherotrites archaeon CG08_land_8_20_14_0_20_30_16]